MLVDDGLLVREEGRWVAAGDCRSEVPPTMQALLAARLDRLEPVERGVIERASVIGEVFAALSWSPEQRPSGTSLRPSWPSSARS